VRTEVTGHPGFFGCILGSEAPERDADAGLATETLIEPPSLFSQGAPNEQALRGRLDHHAGIRSSLGNARRTDFAGR